MMEAETLPEVRQLLSTHASAYWDNHYIFGRPSSQKEKSMGERSQDLIVINTVVPSYMLMVCIEPMSGCVIVPDVFWKS